MGTLRSTWFGEVLDDVLTALPEGGPRLALEITESTLLEADATVSRVLERIRTSGADLGLDDFGTGYSSLAQLQRVPVDFLKLDRSLRPLSTTAAATTRSPWCAPCST